MGCRADRVHRIDVCGVSSSQAAVDRDFHHVHPINIHKHFKETPNLFFQPVPESLLTNKINLELMKITEIAEIHHENCWSLEGEHHVHATHLLLHETLYACQQHAFKKRIAKKLAPSSLNHTSIELEFCDEASRHRRG